jgi:hypothetical protein
MKTPNQLALQLYRYYGEIEAANGLMVCRGSSLGLEKKRNHQSLAESNAN